jgi:hypothetical protein
MKILSQGPDLTDNNDTLPFATKILHAASLAKRGQTEKAIALSHELVKERPDAENVRAFAASLSKG